MSLDTPIHIHEQSLAPRRAALAKHDRQQLPHSLEGAPLPLIGRLFRQHGLRNSGLPQLGTWGKLFAKSLLGVPFRFHERHSQARKAALNSSLQPPVFIIGHWRSGTTHLHNLLTQDEQFGYLAMRHCIAANSFLTLPNWVAKKLESQVPGNRPVDGVEMGWYAPQEEEFALERMTQLSYNHCYLFPDSANQIFQRCVMFETGKADRQKWLNTYHQLLLRLSHDQQGRTLCLKNPPNTARIGLLAEQYPAAKFVFIVRHPEHVFRSTRKLWSTVTRMLGLTHCEADRLDENLLSFYEQLMKKYLRDRAQIPAGQLIEVQYEDLDREPLETLAKIYQQLNLNGYAQAEPAFRQYVEDHARFTRNRHSLSPADCQRVHERWGFAYDAWNYEAPAPLRRAA